MALGPPVATKPSGFAVGFCGDRRPSCHVIHTSRQAMIKTYTIPCHIPLYHIIISYHISYHIAGSAANHGISNTLCWKYHSLPPSQRYHIAYIMPVRHFTRNASHIADCMVNHIVSCRVMSCCIVSCCVVSCCVVSYHIISCHIISYHGISYITPRHTISYHVISCNTISHHSIPYHVSCPILSCTSACNIAGFAEPLSYHIISYHIIYRWLRGKPWHFQYNCTRGHGA